MAYATAIHALKDAATDGFTSTYHTRSEILEGSTVYLRKGVHEFEETIKVARNVTVRPVPASKEPYISCKGALAL